MFLDRKTMKQHSGQLRTIWPTAHASLNILALAYAVGLSLVILYLNRNFYHDDAYITLRYARNLINGNGAVWNPGEYVQGYTNFLHLVLIALLGRFGIDLVWASRIIGIAALVGLLGVLMMFSRYAINGERVRTLRHLPMILTLTSAPMLVWSVGGLEGTLLSLFITAGCLFFLKSMKAVSGYRFHVASGVCFGLGFLTRPDGLIFPFIALIWLLATLKTRARTGFRILFFTASVAIIIAPYCVWQLLYYGDFVPNTFYAKTGSLSLRSLKLGFRYFSEYALLPPYLPLIACASLLYALAVRAWNQKLTYLTLSVSAYALFVIFVGGDHMQAYRLLVPLVAPMSLLFWMPLASFAGNQRLIWVLTCAILTLSSLQLLHGDLNPRKEDPAALIGTAVGKYIADTWPAGSLVALNTAGSTPYHADRHRYIDMLGLNDSHIAKREIKKTHLPRQRMPGHLKGDGAYVLSRQPDFIIIGPADGTGAENPWFLSDLELSRDPRFSQSYVRFEVELPCAIKPLDEKKSVFVYYQRIHKQEGGAAPQIDNAADKR
jgi:hypothetical protein